MTNDERAERIAAAAVRRRAAMVNRGVSEQPRSVKRSVSQATYARLAKERIEQQSKPKSEPDRTDETDKQQ
ncbi:MAG: hypothetical protein F4117_14155 [Acidimicrobiales bacterium]|nr:hypothetical protein [Acidimicrobiales bacterium]MXX44241.1 hypothetical protein [Acidimicrobiales bacterium]MXZ14285.1 hypothetical protein [Acidimicrobiales bacterium]MYB82816.1 hypothetical protein [Acidimicrobiales bacterium]MYD34333.1 hypothetical protein [Acidimicrobiales bacterium]